MITKGQRLSLAVIVLFALATPTFAHHSITSEWDPGKEFTVSGVLSKVEWTNPHIYFFVDVKDPQNGKVTEYAFETNPPGTLHRMGMKRSDFKEGENVTVTAAVAKDGSKNRGFGKMVKFEDGHALIFRVGGE
jgi:hypothetical protein